MPRATTGEAGPPAEPLEPAEAFDPARVLEAAGDDESVVHELVDWFLEDSREMVRQIGDSIAHRDDELLMRTAHSLRGAVSHFHTGAAFAAAGAMEEHGRRGDLAAAAEALDDLEMRILQLQEALTAFVRTRRI